MKDLCLTCKKDKNACFLAQGIEKAIACVSYEKDDKKEYIEEFIELFMKRTSLDKNYASSNAEYYAEGKDCYDIADVPMDVQEAIDAHY